MEKMLVICISLPHSAHQCDCTSPWVPRMSIDLQSPEWSRAAWSPGLLWASSQEESLAVLPWAPSCALLSDSSIHSLFGVYSSIPLPARSRMERRHRWRSRTWRCRRTRHPIWTSRGPWRVSPGRAIWNWLHCSVIPPSHLTGTLTIFFSLCSLPSSDRPKSLILQASIFVRSTFLVAKSRCITCKSTSRLISVFISSHSMPAAFPDRPFHWRSACSTCASCLVLSWALHAVSRWDFPLSCLVFLFPLCLPYRLPVPWRSLWVPFALRPHRAWSRSCASASASHSLRAGRLLCKRLH